MGRVSEPLPDERLMLFGETLGNAPDSPIITVFAGGIVDTKQVGRFIRESNAIEGIVRAPLPNEIEAAKRFLLLLVVCVADLNRLQDAFAPGQPLRDQQGMDVRVGRHLAPPGGRQILRHLIRGILDLANAEAGDPRSARDPWDVHCRFETLHPYMDGNGRTGRMLWAWQMGRSGYDPFALPFLHRWYYQTLDHS
mgnify:CR=1 FL=1